MENEFPSTLIEAVRYFSDPDVCLKFIQNWRWPNGIICPYCKSTRYSFLTTRRLWKCLDCKKQFSVKVGTVLEDSPIGLDKWLLTIWFIVNAKNGISSYEIHRSIGVTQKSAWFMLHRVRELMKSGSLEKFSGIVEVDETYIGGLEKNKHSNKKLRQGRGAVGKTCVLGVLERGKGELPSQVRMKTIQSTGAQTLTMEVVSNVEGGSNVFTDTFPGYNSLPGDYRHESVNHRIGEYVRGEISTNGLENVWSLTKRAIKGTYISCRPKHLDRYLKEEEFRFNHRRTKDAGRFLTLLSQLPSHRHLSWKQLTAQHS